ncbi:MAG: hypothetical protein NVV73_05305 [Cellvibrionaceae bacterium]|nr:hypothetical protein [Cellvibrionaceae bacterium]
MGEWSKKVGETGEKLVKEFFDLIGWSGSKDGLSLPCIKQDRHGGKTHGIDRLFAYRSPLEDGVLNNLVASVKYTAVDYPSSPNSAFRGHFLELAKMIECFKASEIKRSTNRQFAGVDSSKAIGILFLAIQLQRSG